MHACKVCNLHLFEESSLKDSSQGGAQLVLSRVLLAQQQIEIAWIRCRSSVQPET